MKIHFLVKLKLKKENYHRSIISVKNILKDELFDKNNIALKRSREKIKGLHPKFF